MEWKGVEGNGMEWKGVRFQVRLEVKSRVDDA